MQRLTWRTQAVRGLLEGSGLDESQPAPRSQRTAHAGCRAPTSPVLSPNVGLSSRHPQQQPVSRQERPAHRSGRAQTCGSLMLSVCTVITTRWAEGWAHRWFSLEEEHCGVHSQSRQPPAGTESVQMTPALPGNKHQWHLSQAGCRGDTNVSSSSLIQVFLKLLKYWLFHFGGNLTQFQKSNTSTCFCSPLWTTCFLTLTSEWEQAI